MSIEIEIDMTDEHGELVSPEEQRARAQKVFEDLQAKGILVPDQEAPFCIGCGERLENITVKVIGTLTEEEYEIDEDSFQWIPGLHQFSVAPAFFGWVEQDMARFEARCTQCEAPVIGLEIIGHPHGLKFTDETRMAGNL